jgi:hypothetical protein
MIFSENRLPLLRIMLYAADFEGERHDDRNAR